MEFVTQVPRVLRRIGLSTTFFSQTINGSRTAVGTGNGVAVGVGDGVGDGVDVGVGAGVGV